MASIDVLDIIEEYSVVVAPRNEGEIENGEKTFNGIEAVSDGDANMEINRWRSDDAFGRAARAEAVELETDYDYV